MTVHSHWSRLPGCGLNEPSITDDNKMTHLNSKPILHESFLQRRRHGKEVKDARAVGGKYVVADNFPKLTVP